MPGLSTEPAKCMLCKCSFRLTLDECKLSTVVAMSSFIVPICKDTKKNQNYYLAVALYGKNLYKIITRNSFKALLKLLKALYNLSVEKIVINTR